MICESAADDLREANSARQRKILFKMYNKIGQIKLLIIQITKRGEMPMKDYWQLL